MQLPVCPAPPSAPTGPAAPLAELGAAVQAFTRRVEAACAEKELVLRDHAVKLGTDGWQERAARVATWAAGRSWGAGTPRLQVVEGGLTNALFRFFRPAGSPEDGPESVLVRVFGDQTDRIVDRRRDAAVFRLLSERGIGPRFYGSCADGRAEGYVENSRPLRPSEMGKPAIAPLIASAVACLHRTVVPGATGPEVAELWSSLEHWMREVEAVAAEGTLLAESVAKLARPTGGAPDAVAAPSGASHLRGEISWLKERLTTPSPPSTARAADPPSVAKARLAAQAFANETVLCHNDLLSGNLLLVSDSKRPAGCEPSVAASAAASANGPGDAEAARAEGGASPPGSKAPPQAATPGPGARVQLLDFEYAAPNARAFEWANHFCERAGFDFDLEAGYPRALSDKLPFLERYVMETRPALLGDAASCDAARRAFFEELGAQTDRFALASHCFWGLWAVVQARWSPIEFDFELYARMRWNKGFLVHKAAFFPPAAPGEEAV
ncbi:hypothetical protein FNF29_05694 [Cafeteria roenbergensis]|uniref:ethanolamine kinase n=1 Tax=Cafeteria roenbergensis TaxID=33653 RepID=A0A5A8CB65_CAFRO|nr:hypothetical protein FNF29_05694 [Cafeteria roenbergensis]|eukprot:KAA0149869.1 hypothetical protein FNF29_05694 [Cafeteria roenbergensis]